MGKKLSSKIDSLNEKNINVNIDKCMVKNEINYNYENLSNK